MDLGINIMSSILDMLIWVVCGISKRRSFYQDLERENSGIEVNIAGPYKVELKLLRVDENTQRKSKEKLSKNPGKHHL